MEGGNEVGVSLLASSPDLQPRFHGVVKVMMMIMMMCLASLRLFSCMVSSEDGVFVPAALLSPACIYCKLKTACCSLFSVSTTGCWWLAGLPHTTWSRSWQGWRGSDVVLACRDLYISAWLLYQVSPRLFFLFSGCDNFQIWPLLLLVVV